MSRAGTRRTVRARRLAYLIASAGLASLLLLGAVPSAAQESADAPVTEEPAPLPEEAPPPQEPPPLADVPAEAPAAPAPELNAAPAPAEEPATAPLPESAPPTSLPEFVGPLPELPPDDDGVPASVESGDGNGDGVPDAEQAHVASLPAAVDVDGN